MTILRAFICFTLTCGVVWPQCNHKIVAESDRWLPGIVRIQSALNVFDPSKDDLVAYREALRDALSSTDPEVRCQTLWYLRDEADRQGWVDLRQYQDLLNEYAETHPEDASWIDSLLDDADWRAMSRARKSEIYETCIREGEIRVLRRRVFQRFHCVIGAAAGGFVELRPLVESEYDLLPEAIKAVYPRGYVDAVFELTKGVTDGSDAVVTAADRLSRLSPSDLLRRVKQEPGFRAVVLNLGSSACSRRLGNTACLAMGDVRAKLWNAWEEERQGSAERPKESPPSWLERLADSTAPAARFRHAVEWHAKGRPVTPFGRADEMGYYQQIRAEKARRRHSK